MPIVASQFEPVDSNLFDTVEIPEHSKGVALFEVPQSSEKPLSKTNLLRSQQLNSDSHSFTVKRISCAFLKRGKLLGFFPPKRIWTSTVVRFIVEAQLYFEAVAWTIADPYCLVGNLRGQKKHGFFQFTPPLLEIPILIQPGETFRAEAIMFEKHLPTGLEFQLCLSGELMRPVQ